MRLPELLIIGGPRCGTSTLFNMLCQVPGLWGTPQTREVHFFNRHWDKGLAWYAEKFAAAPKGDMLLEATPFYLAAPFVPDRVKRTLPDVKLIVLLRDPVARCISHYWWNRDRFGNDPEVLINSYHHCVVHGHYDEHLHQWAMHFPRKQMLIFASEAFFEAPAEWARHVAIQAAGIPHNVVYGTEVDGVVQVGAVFKHSYYDPLEWRKAKYGPPVIPKEVRSWLRAHYAAHNKRLDKLLASFEISKYWGGKP